MRNRFRLIEGDRADRGVVPEGDDEEGVGLFSYHDLDPDETRGASESSAAWRSGGGTGRRGCSAPAAVRQWGSPVAGEVCASG